MTAAFLFLSVLGLLGFFNLPPAWGQGGAAGERQFYNQLNSVRNQTRPHFNQARQYMGQLRQQGVNTSGWERQLNHIESQLNNMRWSGGQGGRSGTGFQTINPFGDYLFHGVPIRPQDGKLVTRQWDPNGLAARAEEWAKELRGLSKDIDTRQGAERKQFVGELNEKLTQLAAITNQQLKLADLGGGQELKPQTLGEELSLASLPRLEGDTPALLRDPFSRDDPMMGPGGPIFEPRELTQPGIDRIEAPASKVGELNKPEGGQADGNLDTVPLLRSEPGPDAPVTMAWAGTIEAEQTDLRNRLAPLHDALSMAGFIPGGGALADSLNALIYAAEGDWRNAGFSSLAAVPLLGDVASAGKVARVGVGTSYVTWNLDDMGRLTGKQYADLLRLSESSGVKFGIAGGHAENALGLSHRAQLQLPLDLKNPLLPEWRGGRVSQLTDADLWFEKGTDPKIIQRITDAAEKKIFPGKPVDLKYSQYYHTEKDLERAGAIVFEGGASRRIDSYWQKPNLNWPMDSPTPIGHNPQSGRLLPGMVIGPGADPVSGVQLITPWIGN